MVEMKPALVLKPLPIDMRNLPQELRRRRRDARKSQNDVGAALGYTGTMVGYWERGVLDPHWTVMLAWADLLGVQITAQEALR